ncbi:hypothetical protein F5148DRAFT_1173692 [Russula earlei]|uniref:Uncharacterized protein n=1 Tax=Russula earlei TaxID=71964 RepID=A0ACC0UJU1_9AGAM|nr:hypothetical protein F5148DRAFT_1173692 [Russula earlei]
MAEQSAQNQSQMQQAAGPSHSRKRPRKGRKGGAIPTNAASTTPAPEAHASTANGTEEAYSNFIDTETSAAKSDVQAEASQEQDLCWICAEPVKYYAVSECNHRTCHVCALRLRALYKKQGCTFCKELQPTVMFTVSADAPFLSYAPENVPYRDEKLAISFETEEMMQDSLILLRFNCPDPSCDYIATGWNDLELHVRGAHKRFMCALCISHKKVFSHEHALYTFPQYSTHLPSAHRRQQKGVPKDQVEGGVHPLCEFCNECFFGDDELYGHMRHSHEECFICKRNEIRDKYFKDYNALEQHFEQAHHPCSNHICQARKFVVFGSKIDLQAHMVEEHGTEMSSRDKKDARRVSAAFEFQDTSSSSSRRRGGGPGGGGGGRDRGQRDSQPQSAPRPTQASDSRHSFIGAHSTTVGDVNSSSLEPSRRQSPSPPPSFMDPVTAERYTAIFSRLRILIEHHANAIAGVKLALRDYTASQSGARDLISTVWNTLDRDLDATASIITLVVDFLEEEEKKMDLLGAWNTFKIERRREFPDLIIVPTSMGTDYASIANSRVLNAHRVAPPRQSQRAVWDRVAQAAERGATFSPLRTPPSLNAPHPASTGPTPNVRRQGLRNTAWSASAASVSAGGGGSGSSNYNNNASSVSQGGKPAPAPAPPPPAPALTNAAFPMLPSSAASRGRPVVSARTSQLRHILGSAPPTTSAWAPGRVGQDNAVGVGVEDGATAAAEVGASGRKRGKGKQKQTLFMLGSYPSTGAGRQE